MVDNIPTFKANLNVDAAGKGIVSASGTRAEASNFGEIAQFMGEVSAYATDVYTKQQVDMVKQGGLTEEELPSPATVLGQKMRNAFAESQAIETNIQINNKIKEITDNKALSVEGMQQALVGSADAMISANIPEMADGIRSAFARGGVSAINREASSRLQEQRALQNLSQKTQLDYWKNEYVSAYNGKMRTLDAAGDLKEKMSLGPVPEDEYMESYQNIDISSAQRLADAEANIIKLVSSRIAAGNMTEEMGAVYLQQLNKEANIEHLTFKAAEEGLSVLDQTELSFDERLSIAQKASNFAGMKNAEEDRIERKKQDAQDKFFGQQIQSAKNAAISGDLKTAREISANLSKKNEVLGDDGLMGDIDSLNETIDVIAAAGGVANPEAYNFYKRGVQSGRFVSIDEVFADLQFTGRKLNEQEVFDLNEALEKTTEQGLTGAGYQSNIKLIKLRLADDPNEPSPLEKALGAKKTERQKLIEQERDRIEDSLISGVLDKTLITVQQQRDFVESEIRKAKKRIFSTENKILKQHDVDVKDSSADIMKKLKAMYGEKNENLLMQKFKEVKKAQRKTLTEVVDE